MSTWTRGETEVITGAVQAAPSVHDTRPWVLEFRHDTRGVSLFQRLDRALPRHDPLGRDRLISCGAALENLVLAIRVLGWEPEVELVPDRMRPDEVARVTALRRRPPSDVDIARYGAISRRHSHRRPFASTAVGADRRNRVVIASDIPGVQVRPVRADETPVLAQVLGYAALVLRGDRAYQRELSAWTAAGPRSARSATLPWAGLVRSDTAVPDTPTLTARLRRECLLLVETPDDGPLDHVRAGMAAQAVWLAATADGLVGSVLTQPIQLSEVRSGLVEDLSLAGYPQALLRFGIPADNKENQR